MLTRHRGMLTLLTLIVLAAVSVGAGWSLSTGQVDLATASRDQLLRRLVTTDLTAAPREVQVAWVDRLQRELVNQPLPTGGLSEIPPAYRERLLTNFDALQSIWFQTRTAQYASLPRDRREAFLTEQLDVVAAWTALAGRLEGAATGETSGALDGMRALIARIDDWLAAAPENERPAMVLAVQDGALCWLATTDLNEQTLATKRELAARLARELDRGASVEVAELVTTSERRARLSENASQLVAAHVVTLAEEFAPLPVGDRAAFIDAQLAAIERWDLASLVASSGTGDAAAESPTVRGALWLAEQSPQWIAQAPDDHRAEVRELVQAVQQRLLWRQLPAWLRR